MQRYRINYQLLIGLFVGSIVLSIALYLVWKWQVNRKANWYHERAQAALEKDDQLEAFDYLKKFVKLRKEDEEARVELATIAADIAVMDGISRESKGEALGVLSDTVRRTSDSGLRRKLADLQFNYGRPQDAITHIKELLNESEDPELHSLYVRSLFRAKDYNKAIDMAFNLIGYDKLTKGFNGENAIAANQPELYSSLATALLQQRRDPEVARQVIDQMVALNPDSSVAHLQRSIFLYNDDEKEEAATELDKAFQLAPEDADVLYRKAEVNLFENNYEEARRFATEGIEKHPNEMRFYHRLASVDLVSEKYDEALAVLDRAIVEFGEERAIDFFLFKINVLLAKEDIAGTKEVIRDLEKMEISRLQPLIDYQRARVLVQQEKWSDATKILRRVRPQLAIFGRTQAVAGTLLAEAYEKLGKLDLARKVYEIVADDETLSASDPIRNRARASILRVNQRLGLAGEASNTNLNSIVQQMLARPEEEQDWREIESFIEKAVENRSLSEVQEKLLRGEVYSLRGMITESKQMVREAARLAPDDVSVRYAAVKLLLKDLPDGPAIALKQLKKIEEKFGVTFFSRSLTAETLMAIQGEDVEQQLQALTEGTEEWSDADRMRLMATLGLKFQQLDNTDEAVRYLNLAADLDPSNLPLRVHLFELGYQQRDDELMRQAQKKILELVGSKEDSNYVLAEVKRRLINYKEGDEAGRIALQEARRLLEDALKRRPEWHELHVLYGQVLLVLKEDIDLALQHLNEAMEYGRPNANVVALLVRLLAQRGDMKQAGEKMQFIPEAVRGRLLGRVEAAVLLTMGDQEAAFLSAQAEAERQPEDAPTQAWFAEIADQTDHLEEAAVAYRKATELNPLDHNYWTKLVAVHGRQKNYIAMEKALRDAQLALDPEYLPLLQAKSFELRSLWKAAEGIYLDFYEDRLDDPSVAQRMANFYLLWGKSDPSIVQKAVPHLNRILRIAYDGECKFDDATVLWARDKAARILAASGSYQDSVKAQRLLELGSKDGTVPRAFQTLHGEILSSRADPISLLAAIDVLSALNQKGLLDKDQLLLLANLYARTNNWKKGKPLMLDALSRYGSDSKVWSTYISLLIGRGEYKTASQRLNRFAEITSDNNQLFQLRARLAYERGDQAEVRKLLRSQLPPNLGPSTPLTEDQLKMIRAMGGVAVAYEEYELATQLFQLYASRNPAGNFDLLTVMALHGDADKAMPVMMKLAQENPETIARLAIQMVRQRRTELGDRFDDQVSELVLSIWREDPDLANRLVLRAEMFEVLERYDEAIAAYEDIVDRDDLSENARAAASNNLAYLLALRNQRLDTAQEKIDEAIEILGPLADILDTRAVIRMARQEYDLAVEDMTLSLSIDPTAVKYYHLAKAQALAGNEDQALDAWAMAKEMDIEKESLPLIEQPGYQETEQLIKNFGSGATASNP